MEMQPHWPLPAAHSSRSDNMIQDEATGDDEDSSDGMATEETAGMRAFLEAKEDERGSWVPQVTPDGRLFYLNVSTGVSTSEPPRSAPKAKSNLSAARTNDSTFIVPKNSHPQAELNGWRRTSQSEQGPSGEREAVLASRKPEQIRAAKVKRPSSNRLLIDALTKANEAVALDNAGKIHEARLCYREAINLLQEVMGRTRPGSDDNGKLTAIRDTYLQREGELYALDDSKYPALPGNRDEELLVDKAFVPSGAEENATNPHDDQLAEDFGSLFGGPTDTVKTQRPTNVRSVIAVHAEIH